METVFVSEYSYARGRRVFEGLNAEGALRFVAVPDEEAALAERIRAEGVRAFVASGAVFSGPLYEALAEGGIIVRFGVGHEGIDKAKARKHGVWVANTPGCLENAVAEHGLWLMGCLARKLPEQMRDLREGKWRAREGGELGGRKLAIVGFGRIGRHLCRKAALGLGMAVTGVGRAPESEYAAALERSMESLREEFGFEAYRTDREAVLREADFAVVLAAATGRTRHLVDERFLGEMKRGAFLVNLARGSLVDEGALYDALVAGRIAGAALDVFEKEPYVPSGVHVDRGGLEIDAGASAEAVKDLRLLPNVIMTPHVASDTEEANDAMARCAARTVKAALEGNAESLGNLIR